MLEPVLPGALWNLLRASDTPTVCNAIETVQGKRGFNRFTRGTLHHSNPAAGAMLGFASTAKIAGFSPPEEAPDILRARRIEYFRAMASGPRPALAVVEDTDFPNCIAGWWGEVHAAVHKGLGLAGAVTNGVMRDLDAMDESFLVLAGSIGVSHGFVHVAGLGEPVSIFGMRVEPGDLVHADRHGALVIPPEVLPGLADGIETVARNEAIILEPAQEPGFDIEKLEAAWVRFEAARV